MIALERCLRRCARKRLLVLSLGACSFAQAQIYVSDGSGAGERVRLSNFPSGQTPVLLIDDPSARSATTTATISVESAPPRAATMMRAPSPQANGLIIRIASEFAVPEALVRAVVAVESGFDPRARSRKGAMGLMQLMPDTARRFGVIDPYSEEQNLRGGTAYLRWLLDTFAGNVNLTLAAYNAGEAAVIRAGYRIPNYAETQAYVPRVLAYVVRFKADAATRTP